MSDAESDFLNGDKDREDIRSELSQMSFEDLQKLKERLGTKVYNEAAFGVGKKKKIPVKRTSNKNGPIEMSAKKPVRQLREVIQVKKHIARDPRFDSLCGTFNQKAFTNSYKFVNKLKENDLNALRVELEKTDDPERVKQIKYLIQRLENQLREQRKHEQQEEKKFEEKKQQLEAIKNGEKPDYKKKSEKKILDLIDQYEDLKNSGRVKKHIQRLQKKNSHKDRRKFEGSKTQDWNS